MLASPKVRKAVIPARFDISGRYLLEPAIWDFIGQTDPDASGEVQLTDALNLLCRERPLYGLCFKVPYYDAGDPLGYLIANLEMALRNPYHQQPLLQYLSCMRAESELAALSTFFPAPIPQHQIPPSRPLA